MTFASALRRFLTLLGRLVERMLDSIRSVVVIMLLIASLALNVSLVVFDKVTDFVSTTYSTITDATTVHGRMKARLATTSAELSTTRRELSASRDREQILDRDLDKSRAELVRQRTKIDELSGQVTKLEGDLTRSRTQSNAELARRQARIDELSNRASRATTTDNVRYRGKTVMMRDAVRDTSERINRRAVVNAGRNIGSMAGEALPVLGIAVIAAVTALEISDLCETLRDMEELNAALDPLNAKPESERSQCPWTVPSRDELWAQVTESPQKAWDLAIEHVPDLPEIREMHVDWRGYLSLVTGVMDDLMDYAGSTSRNAWDKAVNGAMQSFGALVDLISPSTE